MGEDPDRDTLIGSNDADSETSALYCVYPDAGRGSGARQAAAEGLVTAGVDFHRGFDASTTLHLDARAGAEIAQMLHASLSGGTSARAAGQIQVGIPLDLFSERSGGRLARLRLQLEAGAFHRAEGGMTGAVFAEELGKRVPRPLDKLLEIFLTEPSSTRG